MAQQELKDKIPPHDSEAERSALGSMMLEQQAVIDSLTLLKPEDFYSNANAKVFRAIQSLSNKGGVRPDIITVCDELKQAGELDSSGGEAYVSSLTNSVPTAANIKYYIDIIKDRALRRSLLVISSKIAAKAYEIPEDSYQILEKAQQYIFELIEQKQYYKYRDIKSLLHDTINWMEENLDKEFTGLTCGFSEIDHLTSGFQKSEMIVIGARPSIGKTALALNMAANIAIMQKKPVAFFSLEMAGEQLMMRVLAAEAEIDTRSIKRQTNTEKSNSFNKIGHAAGRLSDAPLFVEDIPNMSLIDLRTQARHVREVEKVEIIFIDYLGLISMENTYMPRYEQVSEISRSIKSLARELAIPVVVLSQVGRQSEGAKPTLANLRDSGAVEQDADVVILLHRDRENSNTEEAPPEFLITDVYVEKNRNGPTGMAKLAYYKNWTKFKNYDWRKDN
jgi:replicative DNA helicase